MTAFGLYEFDLNKKGSDYLSDPLFKQL